MSFRKEKPTPCLKVEESIDKAYQYYREGKIEEQLKVIRKLVEGYSRKRVDNKLLPSGQISAIKRLIAVIKNQTPKEYPEAQLIHAMFLARDGRVEEALTKYQEIHVQYPDYLEAYFKHKMLALSINAKDGNIKLLDKAITRLMKVNKKKEKIAPEESNNGYAFDGLVENDARDPLMELYEKLLSPKRWFSTSVEDSEKSGDSMEERMSTASTSSSSSAPSPSPAYGRESPLPRAANKSEYFSPILHSCYSLFGSNPGSDKFVEILNEFKKIKQ